MSSGLTLEEFLVTVRRSDQEKIGMRVACDKEKMFVESVTGANLIQLRERCRGCKVPEVAFHYLMEGDQILRINKATSVADMVKVLNASELMHFRVLRGRDHSLVESSAEGLHSASTSMEECAPATGIVTNSSRRSAWEAFVGTNLRKSPHRAT